MMYPGINKVIALLNMTEPHRFSMNTTLTDTQIRAILQNHCGSPLCIGGLCHFVLWLAGVKLPYDKYPKDEEADDEDTYSDPEIALAEIANIPIEDSKKICWPERPCSKVYTQATKDDAIWMLEKYRDTGEVDWKTISEGMEDRDYPPEYEENA